MCGLCVKESGESRRAGRAYRIGYPAIHLTPERIASEVEVSMPVRPRFARLRIFIAFCGLLGSAGIAGAVIVHVDLGASPHIIPAGLDGIYLNLVNGTTSTASTPPAGWDFNPYHNGTGIAFFGPASPSGQGTLASGPTAIALLGGERIGSANLYQPGQALGTNFFITGVSFAGVRFQNESAGQLNYAWVKLRTTGSNGFPASILAYAYEDSGAPLTAGQIPEPSAAAVLVLSGMWFAVRRRLS